MIEIQNLTKTFSVVGEDGKQETFDALKNVSLTVGDGEIYGIIGMSGAGKSTLVRCINMLERPTEGKVLIDGTDMGSLSEKELRQMRRSITMIFQGFNLLMQRTCLDNICFPLELSGVKRTEAVRRASELLETVGLPDKAKAYPAQLSGGQQQRIAIARALATQPKVLLCDEATSALDPNTTHAILELIRDINKKLGITVIIITHQMSVVEEVCSHVAILDHGCVVETGEVAEVFSAPKSDAARRLVFPDADKSPMEAEIPGGIPAAGNPDDIPVRLVFDGSHTTDRAMITQMAIDTGIAVNILYASTRCIGDKVFGNMLLGIPGGMEAVERVKAYFADDPQIMIEPAAKEDRADA
ncbi:MAG: ATP-binding cassette domain-containing protein [Clostridia bacterium]|nr:ATP-binding cassette domain-containing protein [Clostridia bacterium]